MNQDPVAEEPGRLATTSHLARRFVGSLRPGGPPAAVVTWVQTVLRPEEWALWSRLSGPDRRHSAGVAQMVSAELGAGSGPSVPRSVLAAALLHDIGKLDARLRTFGRVVATLTIALVGRTEVVQWQQARGLHRRIALYARHPEIGGEMLTLASSDPLTIAWTREHHLPREQWSVEPRYADVLDRCDND